MPVKKNMSPAMATMRLEALCSRSEQCSYELRQKLHLWGIDGAEAETIITHLCQGGFVDDARFARAYCNDKLQFNRWGKVKILHGLVVKHIPRDIIAEALDSLDSTLYRDTLVALLQSKMRTLADAHSYDGRTRLFRFAASRGFEPSLVTEVIRQLCTAASDNG